MAWRVGARHWHSMRLWRTRHVPRHVCMPRHCKPCWKAYVVGRCAACFGVCQLWQSAHWYPPPQSVSIVCRSAPGLFRRCRSMCGPSWVQSALPAPCTPLAAQCTSSCMRHADVLRCWLYAHVLPGTGRLGCGGAAKCQPHLTLTNPSAAVVGTSCGRAQSCVCAAPLTSGQVRQSGRGGGVVLTVVPSRRRPAH